MDWFDVPAIHRTLKSLLQHHSSEASIIPLALRPRHGPALIYGNYSCGSRLREMTGPAGDHATSELHPSSSEGRPTCLSRACASPRGREQGAGTTAPGPNRAPAISKSPSAGDGWLLDGKATHLLKQERCPNALPKRDSGRC